MPRNSSSNENGVVPDLVSDCRLMLRYARKNGADLSPELQHEIAQLDSLLKYWRLSPVSDIPAVLVQCKPWICEEPPPEAPPKANQVAAASELTSVPANASSRSDSEAVASPGATAEFANKPAGAFDVPTGSTTDAPSKLDDSATVQANLVTDVPRKPEPATSASAAATIAAKPLLLPTELILKVHGELSQVVAPATALSLQTTEPPPGAHRFLGGMPLVVKAAALASLICAGGFVTSAGFIAAKASVARPALEAQQQNTGANKKAGEAGKADEKKARADGEGEKK